MQRLFTFALVVIVTLYGSTHAFPTHAEEYYAHEGMPAVASMSQPVPHIALLLPLQSSSFGQAAEVVKDGFVAATMRGEPLPLTIRIYSTTDDPLDVLITYHQALDAGAVLIIGPLTRNGVSALASSHVVHVPTLALNAADNESGFPSNLYLFGLQMENEAAQIAEFAMTENKHHAIIINDGSPLSIRLQTAFSARWLAQYGNTAESVQYEDDPEVLTQLRAHTRGENNIIFLAVDAAKARLTRSFLNPNTPVYATSQLFVSHEDSLFNNDLNGIRFMDMPWLIQPDHPAVMAYRHTEQARSADMERLYALGIDAFRLMAMMLEAQTAQEISFDGVTGHIRFIPPNQYVREPVAAKFDKGKVILLNKYKQPSLNER
jgi:uncharacterized protein